MSSSLQSPHHHRDRTTVCRLLPLLARDSSGSGGFLAPILWCASARVFIRGTTSASHMPIAAGTTTATSSSSTGTVSTGILWRSLRNIALTATSIVPSTATVMIATRASIVVWLSLDHHSMERFCRWKTVFTHDTDACAYPSSSVTTKARMHQHTHRAWATVTTWSERPHSLSNTREQASKQTIKQYRRGTHICAHFWNRGRTHIEFPLFGVIPATSRFGILRLRHSIERLAAHGVEEVVLDIRNIRLCCCALRLLLLLQLVFVKLRVHRLLVPSREDTHTHTHKQRQTDRERERERERNADETSVRGLDHEHVVYVLRSILHAHTHSLTHVEYVHPKRERRIVCGDRDRRTSKSKSAV